MHTYNFQIGDLVEAVDDTLKGTVLKFIGRQVVIETEDGFQMSYDVTELVPLASSGTMQVTNAEVAQAKTDKQPIKKKQTSLKSKERNAPKMEVDLHIHQLVQSSKNMSNYEMLDIQLQTAQRQLEFAIRKRIQKVVFIHGVGAGVLKEELKYLFGKYENLKYYDADYQKYGLGATEIYIYQNP